MTAAIVPADTQNDNRSSSGRSTSVMNAQIDAAYRCGDRVELDRLLRLQLAAARLEVRGIRYV